MATSVTKEDQAESAQSPIPSLDRYLRPQMIEDPISVADAASHLRSVLFQTEHDDRVTAKLNTLYHFEGRKILIVGAGNAGLELAREAITNGYFAVIVDADDQPGGLGGGAGAKNRGGLSSIQKPKEKRMVDIEAMQVLDHEHALFLPNTWVDIRDSRELDLLGFDGIVIATGAPEKKLPKLEYNHTHIFTATEFIGAAQMSLDQSGQIANAEYLLGPTQDNPHQRLKSIARDPDGKLGEILFVGGGNVAIQDAPMHAQAMRIKDELRRKHGYRLEYERLDPTLLYLGAGGMIEKATAMGLTEEDLRGNTVVSYKEKGLMRPKDVDEPLVIARIADALANHASDAAFAGLTLEDLRKPEHAAKYDQLFDEASEIVRNDPAWKHKIESIVSTLQAKVGTEILEEATIRQVEDANDGTGRLRVTLRVGGETEVRVVGAIVTAVGFEKQTEQLNHRTPWVRAGMAADGRGNLKKSSISARQAFEELARKMDKTDRVHDGRAVAAKMAKWTERAASQGYSGNVIEWMLANGPQYYMRRYFLNSGREGIGSMKPPAPIAVEHGPVFPAEQLYAYTDLDPETQQQVFIRAAGDFVASYYTQLYELWKTLTRSGEVVPVGQDVEELRRVDEQMDAIGALLGAMSNQNAMQFVTLPYTYLYAEGDVREDGYELFMIPANEHINGNARRVGLRVTGSGDVLFSIGDGWSRPNMLGLAEMRTFVAQGIVSLFDAGVAFDTFDLPDISSVALVPESLFADSV